ncbi:MAG: hypothetical protein A2X46_00895 [Lentisphaerae bacterium GWF2_57_35]|nr:MAG: hypothetical protein A2X46_00895 [Lentisphaerae bacterium GWF2_57_35]
MDSFLTGIAMGLAMSLAIGLVLWRRRRKSLIKGGPRTNVHVSIEELRSIGELSVFKVLTKEIVTAKDHWLGEFGKKYMEWVVSSKKMAMIFEFDISFQYNLRDSSFVVEDLGQGAYRLKMPRCKYDIFIRDITFYDEQRSRFLPWLIPDLLNDVFGPGFNEEDRNRLKREAREQAEALAGNLVHRLRSEVQSSARETMELLAKGFSARQVIVDFQDAAPEQDKVAYAGASDLKS